jgi:hypothetical protein
MPLKTLDPIGPRAVGERVNMADLTDFRNILLDGLYLVSFASFQTFRNANKTIRLKVLPMTPQV